MVPEVQLTIQNMKHTILAALVEREGQFTGELEGALDQAIREFDFRGEVKELASRVLKEKITSAMRSLLYDGQFERDFTRALSNALAKQAEE